MPNTQSVPGTTEFVIDSIFERQFGQELGKTIKDLFLASPNDLPAAVARSGLYDTLVERILANNHIADVQTNGCPNDDAERRVLMARQRRCRARADNLQVLTPFLRDERDGENLMTRANAAYIAVADLEASILSQVLGQNQFVTE